ncbi:ATP-binding cassette domain-containing protein [Lagierella sp.]|uniref:ABC transporter ATP-binding protein n=1 Tax=Lagierella sp. TaxID=2849657 RepID=UPI00262EAC9B|nr:ATP-binding cassette domain-containing protein [Lagierella sp.]
MLELKNIKKTFNKTSPNPTILFKDLNLDFKSGEFVTIIGSNGSGKSTLLNIISGGVGVDSGEVFLKGKEITNTKDFQRYRYIGRVFQNPALGNCSTMTVFENLLLAENKNKKWNLTKVLDENKRKFYQEKLQEIGLGLENKLDIPMEKLSGGQRQVISLLMATLSDIELLILDEHTAALDPKTAEKVMEITRKLVEDRKLTTLMVTHNLGHAIEYGDRLIMLHEGEVILDLNEKEKENAKMDDLLNIFNKISIRRGNSI